VGRGLDAAVVEREQLSALVYRGVAAADHVLAKFGELQKQLAARGNDLFETA
jgi:hypothetical protein